MNVIVIRTSLSNQWFFDLCKLKMVTFFDLCCLTWVSDKNSDHMINAYLKKNDYQKMCLKFWKIDHVLLFRVAYHCPELRLNRSLWPLASWMLDTLLRSLLWEWFSFRESQIRYFEELQDERIQPKIESNTPATIPMQSIVHMAATLDLCITRFGLCIAYVCDKREKKADEEFENKLKYSIKKSI